VLQCVFQCVAVFFDNDLSSQLKVVCVAVSVAVCVAVCVAVFFNNDLSSQLKVVFAE